MTLRMLRAPSFVLCLTIPAICAFAQTTTWTPTKPVEMLVGVSPGGGIDRTARTLQKIMQEQHFVETPVNVVNKPGGGSTLVQAYLNLKQGDAHYYEITATSLLTNHITGKSTWSHRDFTPVAMLYDEFLGFAVAADSPIKDARTCFRHSRRVLIRSRSESQRARAIRITSAQASSRKQQERM